ncbi:hypothetical protein E2C01_005328 [Portunus trituberculatus]|uniref:Secreted protein n=1 Tax=Portunus trituberculatus TaxID=210409 RepID=A0A5B7CTS2_PORTR|nr:hypothetical protein [Portunus trituberculatus]
MLASFIPAQVAWNQTMHLLHATAFCLLATLSSQVPQALKTIFVQEAAPSDQAKDRKKHSQHTERRNLLQKCNLDLDATNCSERGLLERGVTLPHTFTMSSQHLLPSRTGETSSSGLL